MDVVADSPQLPVEIIVPHHPHKLKEVNPRVVYQTFNGYWKCDNCNEESLPSMFPFNCSICSFDLCRKCATAHRSPAHEHPIYYVNSTELLYRQTTNGVWRCDACRRTNAELEDGYSYHCPSCEFDLCRTCFSEINHPIHCHVLRVANTNCVYAHTGGNWVCDFCHKTSRTHERHSFHCESCEFDACYNCVREHTIPTHPHPLVRADANFIYSQFSGGWRCDNCGSIHGSADDNKPWHCQQCEYDLCQDCMRHLDPEYTVMASDVTGPNMGSNDIRNMSAVNNPHQERMLVQSEPVEPKAPVEFKSECGNAVTTPAEDADCMEQCIICLEQPKNATLIHGDTGHLCCCWSCAQVLKRRGDPCPICRSPIDHVIRQYTA